jgi:hypothetical protein
LPVPPQPEKGAILDAAEGDGDSAEDAAATPGGGDDQSDVLRALEYPPNVIVQQMVTCGLLNKEDVPRMARALEAEIKRFNNALADDSSDEVFQDRRPSSINAVMSTTEISGTAPPPEPEK